MSSISNQLKIYREINHLSQKQVAEALEISPSAYHHYESGARTPGADTLQKLALLYNLEEPLLGIFKKSNSVTSIPRAYTISDIIKNTALDLDLQSSSRKLYITENQFTALCNYLRNGDEEKKKLLKEIASSKANNDGKIYEALVYTWLDAQGIPFTTQPLIKAEECLKRNDYYADGMLDDYCVFDVKMFGLSHPNIDRLRSKLNSLCKKHNPEYLITVSGQLDVSNDILQEMLSNTKKIYSDLFDASNKLFTDYVYRIPKANLEIRAHLMKNTHMISSISEINPYKWAEENQYNFFHDASQFCIDRPYVIICPYDKKIATHFADGFSSSTSAAFRSLCRRIFLGMPEDKYAQEYDRKCLPAISLKEASRYISALIFQDISMNPDLDDVTWIYLNPHAKKQMPKYIADSFRFHTNSTLEDFAYDNY